MAWLMVVSLVMGRNFLGSKRAMLVWRQMRYANLLSSASLWIIVEALLFGTHGSLHFTARTRSKCDVCHVIRIFSSEAQSPMTGAVHPRPASIASLRGVLAAVCGMVLVWMVGTANGAADFDRLLSSLTQRWGSAPTAKFNAWRAMVQAGTTSSDLDRIKRVNSFFNQQLQFAEDSLVWSRTSPNRLDGRSPIVGLGPHQTVLCKLQLLVKKTVHPLDPIEIRTGRPGLHHGPPGIELCSGCAAPTLSQAGEQAVKVRSAIGGPYHPHQHHAAHSGQHPAQRSDGSSAWVYGSSHGRLCFAGKNPDNVTFIAFRPGSRREMETTMCPKKEGLHDNPEASA